VRLVKFLAHAGVASRRRAEDVIAAGRVTVGGEVVRDPARAVEPGDDVRVDGRPAQVDETPLVYALHKPAGVVSTASDPQGRRTVVDLVRAPGGARLYPVGRLDVDTTGLLLLTNDGELANHLTHPRYGVTKTYRATVRHPPVASEAIERLREGVELDDGPTLPARVRLVRPGIVELELREGRKRQVRRMLEAVGHPVRALERVRFGPLALGDLPAGGVRRLSDAEVARLRRA
jgi:23S rRNA pseudouridine2605 synthase